MKFILLLFIIYECFVLGQWYDIQKALKDIILYNKKTDTKNK